MFPPPDSTVGRMVEELGLDVMPITGSMLNVYLRGKLIRDTRPELLPFRLPLALRARLSFARAGLRLKRDADRYMRLIAPRPGDTDSEIRLRALQHRGDETFADFLGHLHPLAFEVYQAIANRSLAEPHETEPMRWDGLYSILTPDKSFNMFFNHANFMRSAGAGKQGSVLMVYAGGDRGRALMKLDEDEIQRRFLDDLHEIYPQVRGIIAETMVRKWQYAGPFAAPGRCRFQAVLERG